MPSAVPGYGAPLLERDMSLRPKESRLETIHGIGGRRVTAIEAFLPRSCRTVCGQAKAFRIGKLPVRTWERKIQS